MVWGEVAGTGQRRVSPNQDSVAHDLIVFFYQLSLLYALDLGLLGP